MRTYKYRSIIILSISALVLFLLASAALRPASAESNTIVAYISEIDVDQGVVDGAEFVELHDYGLGNLLLDDYVLVFYDGATDTSYAAFDLDGHSTGADGLFVLCGDIANVPACDMDVTPDTELIQDAPGAIALYIDRAASDFPNGTAATTDLPYLVSVIVYDTGAADDVGLMAALGEDTQHNEDAGGNSDINSIQRLIVARDNGAFYTVGFPSAGGPNQSPTAVNLSQLNTTNKQRSISLLPIVLLAVFATGLTLKKRSG